MVAGPQIQYPACECVDPSTNDFADHMPCELPSLVIVRTVYTDAEADRRDQEEKEVLEALDDVTSDILDFMDTPVSQPD